MRLLSRQRIPYDVPMAEPPNGARPLAYHSRAPRPRLWAPRQRFAHPPTFPFSATMQGVRAMASNLACSHLSFTGRSQSTCRVCRPPALCARWAPIADDRGRHAHDNDPMTIGPPRASRSLGASRRRSRAWHAHDSNSMIASEPCLFTRTLPSALGAHCIARDVPPCGARRKPATVARVDRARCSAPPR